MANEEYYYIQAGGYVLLKGQRITMSQAHIRYERNRIPEATIYLPVGRNMQADNFNNISDAQGLLSSLEPMTPIEIIVTLEVFEGTLAAPKGKDPGFSGGDNVVFIGFVAGPAQEKNYESATASLVIRAYGEPVGLAGSTAFTQGLTTEMGGSGGNRAPVRLGAQPSTDIYNATIAEIGPRVDGDIWGSGIAQLIKLALGQLSAWGSDANDKARAAFNRIITPSTLEIKSIGGGDFQTLLRKNLCSLLSNYFQQGWSDDADMWDFINGCREAFGFSFIPAVKNDAIVAFTPNLGGAPWCEIDPSEYDRSSLQSNFDPKFYAYVNQVAVTSRHACSSNWQAKAPSTRNVGSYQLKAWRDPGRLKSVEAPEWLTPRSAAARGTSGAAGGVPDKGNTQNTGTGQDEHSQQEQAFYDGGLGDAYAETVVHEMLFAHRRGGFAGRFRLDIAPGSLLKINTVGDRFTGIDDTMWAAVEAVNLHIGAGKAYTAFALSHLRSDIEHNKFTTPVHPLFKKTWVGQRLLEY